MIDRPESIWNMDETGLCLEHTPQKVVASSGARFVPGRVSSSRDNITVVACVNAAGGRMPPVCIVKGKTSKSLLSYGTDEGPDDAIWTYQSNAYMEDVLGHTWFDSVFLKYCGKARPQLLIMDQHESHEVSSLLTKAVEENIVILALPAHNSHWLQPLDKGVFGPLKTFFNKVCSEYTSETQRTVTKCVWPKLIKEAWNMALTPSNIRSGFRTTGIYPLNASAIPSKAFAPSLMSNTATSTAASDATATADSESAITPVTSLSNNETDIVGLAAEHSNETPVLMDRPQATSSASEPNSAAIPRAYAVDLPTPDPGSSITVQINPTDDQNIVPTVNWNLDLDQLFTTVPSSSDIPATCPPISFTESKTNKTKTEHRILTSEAMKKVKEEQKEQNKKAAEERKRKREAKQQALWLQNLIEKLNYNQ